MILAPASDEMGRLKLAALIVASLTLVRVLILVFTPLQLYPDEAQYWWWSQSLDWGYFSKPPLIAWIIRVTTLSGDSEWAVRLASPLLHGGTALVIFGIGRLTYNSRVGFWSALAYATLPGVSYSCGLISTDVPLLFCWAVALYAFLRALRDSRWRWPALCGAAIGFGLLAKYAMLYFVLGIGISAAVLPEAHSFVFSRRGALACVVAIVFISPNLAWNAVHGFPTFVHTEANANWSHARYSGANASMFLLGQFGVFGPLMMAGFLSSAWKLWRAGDASEHALLLAAFSIPVLILMIAQAFISEANANWAAVAYVGAVPLAVETLLRWWKGSALGVSIAIAAAVMLGLWAGMLKPSLADMAGLGNGLKREQGWRQLGTEVLTEAGQRRYEAVVASNRSVLAELLYYAMPIAPRIRAWDRTATPHDHFQMAIPLRSGSSCALLVLLPDEVRAVLASFDSQRFLERLAISIGGHRIRTISFYHACGYHGPQPFP